MTSKPLEILELDPLGQGVAKQDGEIFFIPKTLPGELVNVKTINKSRGVVFAQNESIEKSSGIRIIPDCPHFFQCPGCHFLHTSYDQELNFKEQALRRIFRKWDSFSLETIGATERFGYRNRIQLHYDKTQNLLGLFSVQEKKIIPIPECIIPLPQVKEKINELYQNNYWLELASNEKDVGHLEIYFQHNKVYVIFNRPYADEGFSQVNPGMNKLLVQKVESIIDRLPEEKNILELFGGKGNLTNNVKDKKIYSLDVNIGNDNSNTTFFKINLYNENELNSFQKKSKLKSADILLLDPPRTGFKFLKNWAAKFEPNYLVYVSCEPATLERDLRSIQDKFELQELYLLDLFPSTYHFETIAILKNKQP